ncbi:MAG: hypothetical protein K0R61_3855, partial [Microvirga sp.]|nr:hypothetical protein [Microvirga sp.]
IELFMGLSVDVDGEPDSIQLLSHRAALARH